MNMKGTSALGRLLQPSYQNAGIRSAIQSRQSPRDILI
jgi:hypothetical protein